MLRGTVKFGLAVLVVIPALGSLSASLLAGPPGGKRRDSAPISSADPGSRAVEVVGTVSKLDLKKHTLVVTQRDDRGQRDKIVSLSWHKSVKPQQDGKSVDWSVVREGKLVTVKYVPGKEPCSLTALTLAR